MGFGFFTYISFSLSVQLISSSSGMKDDEIVDEVHKVNGCIQ